MTTSITKPVWLDGGLATTLQDQGQLAIGASPTSLLLDQPEVIAQTHRMFVDAGAQAVLTATFRCLDHLISDAGKRAQRAVHAARMAEPTAVWGSIGPSGLRPDQHQIASQSWAELARALDGVDGIVLETFTHLEEAELALATVLSVTDVPVVLSMFPLATRDLPQAQQRAASLGAAGFGINCVSGVAVSDALASLPPILPRWLKLGPDSLHRNEFASQAHWYGGCCGVSPDRLRAARLAADAVAHSTPQTSPD